MSEAPGLRLVYVRVDGYGRLRDFSFQPDPIPGAIVVAPNETGKSTLVSAIRRGLFGFDDKAREEARRPWEGGPFRVRLRWELGREELCTITRDFDTQAVIVEWRRRLPGGKKALESRWEGSPNPRGRSAELAEYEAELKRLLGFAAPQIFLQTALVSPGGPDARPLETELLRLLWGGERADFRAALENLQDGHYDVTQFDIDDPERRTKRLPRRLEEMNGRQREIEERRQTALTAGQARREAEERLEKVSSELVQVEKELEERGRIREALAVLDGVQQEIATAEKRMEELETEIGRFQDWEKTVRDRESELRPLVPYLHKPPDFLEQLGEMERLARERTQRVGARARLQSAATPRDRRARVMVWSGAAWIAGAIAAWLLGAPIVVAGGLGAIGMALLLAVGWAKVRASPRRDGDETRHVLDEEIERFDRERRALAGSLGLSSGADLAEERDRYLLARKLSHQLDGMQEAHRALGERAPLEEERRRLKEGRLDVLRLEERRILEGHPWLARDPDYVRRFPSETRAVETRRRELQAQLTAVERELMTLPPPADDPARLSEEIDALARQREEATLERDAYRLAYRTLLGCKNEFVRVVTARLARRIGEVFGELSGGRYTAVRIDPETLALAVDGVERMNVPADDLSHGARDELYFALRIAVLDVLAAQRGLPLILDDPFLHFDEERLAQAGRTLERLGKRHQILLLTHDARLAGWAFPYFEMPPLSGVVQASSG